MDEKSLKTSTWQRIVIIVVAVLLIGSTILTYMFVVLNSQSQSGTKVDEAKIAELTAAYDAKNAELTEAAKPLSDKYFGTMKSYRDRVKSFNSTTVNDGILKISDLKEGTGKALAKGDTDYSAYYIGWCADGTVFDSSFDDYEKPTALKTPLDASMGLIEGWEEGVIGMKLGGVRELAIAGSLAYGDTRSICGGYNSPLKFVVLAIEKDAKITELSNEVNNLFAQLYMAYYGQ